ncbi:MAG: hypothetical protein A2X56_04315 [Nitrospirae bacterium GWC2_57_13]|jgi:hypothetical protein|nr:MAG: hypothetical protein A2072_06225 [Nitrospirae bacterium GWC1_57_7]OGW26674.1 MAG: hypothetical protein A2X56_04315 [Nitrospirae bacterium GWC2_57_13]OGW44483.1 MAG: hypothetical protein A2X57_05915 [Nitrospirae bacterium GWD2_57_8]HAR45034.1 hypothetical protein [Nitrospiraceae bacterium]HAS54656.1 hypothetical protein [Nitrospiraceae bacterium]
MTQCLETKRTLSGNTERYQCELVSLQDGFGILRYVTDQHYDIAGFRLSPGDETLALYWANAPYTLYIWHRKTQGDRAYYFNIADSVVLTPREFTWRDLAVDILITPKNEPIILDEHELPADLDRGLADHITRSKEHILANYQDLIKEAEQLLAFFKKHNSAG